MLKPVDIFHSSSTTFFYKIEMLKLVALKCAPVACLNHLDISIENLNSGKVVTETSIKVCDD